MKKLYVLFILTTLFSTRALSQQESVDQDFQSWNVLRFSAVVSPKWTVSMQNEARFADNITFLEEYIFKLYAHHQFSNKFGLSFGYKYIVRTQGSNETDPWAELVFPHKASQWQLSHDVRFETRIYEGISGIIPRVRYLFNWSRQINESPYYATGFGAVRFNLAEKNEGPVAGFEQIRLYAGIGAHLSAVTRLELGYLYRFEDIRDAPDFSDNVIHLNLFFTFNRKGKKPLPNDHRL